MLKKARKAIDVSRLFGLLAVAAGEGFEPSHTESESAVLPLHNPAICACALGERKSYYTIFFPIVKHKSKKFAKTASLFRGRGFVYFSR